MADRVKNVAETLTKWSLGGMGVLLKGGASVAFGTTKMAVNLAKDFSGDSMGTPIGDAMVKTTNNLLDTGVKTAQKAGVAAAGYIVSKVSNRT